MQDFAELCCYVRFLPPSVWSVAFGVLATMLMCQLIQVSDGSKVAGLICVIVMLDNSPYLGRMPFTALWETGLGVALAHVCAAPICHGYLASYFWIVMVQSAAS